MLAEEARKLRRRCSNRRSAHRVKARRKAQSEELQERVDQAKVHIASTEEKLAELQTYQGLLVTAASDVKRRHQTALAQNQCLLQLVGRLETCVQKSMIRGTMTTFNSQTNLNQDMCESLSEDDANAVPSDLSTALVEDLPMMQLLSPSTEFTDLSNSSDF